VSSSRMRALRVIGTRKYVPAARGRRNEMRKRKSDQQAQRAGRLELFWEASLPRRSQGLTVRTTRPNQQTPAGIFASTKS
jgi:hypothetical protein